MHLTQATRSPERASLILRQLRRLTPVWPAILGEQRGPAVSDHTPCHPPHRRWIETLRTPLVRRQRRDSMARRGNTLQRRTIPDSDRQDKPIPKRPSQIRRCDMPLNSGCHQPQGQKAPGRREASDDESCGGSRVRGQPRPYEDSMPFSGINMHSEESVGSMPACAGRERRLSPWCYLKAALRACLDEGPCERICFGRNANPRTPVAASEG